MPGDTVPDGTIAIRHLAMSGHSLEDHFFAPGPKRILALDGGGVRGVISLAYLERLETLLRGRLGPDLVLADYFDLIGGTSTGAIIAAGLALGAPVAKLIDTYLTLATKGFRPTIWHAYWAPKFRSAPLLAQIHAQIGETTLGSPAVRTGLAIVAKRIDTGSVWVFHNHPRGPYFDPANRHAGAVPNKDLLLAQLLRASTAAPTFFAPQRIEVARGVTGVFVDGSVSPHNNPALLMFLLATLRGYGFRWPVGAERLMLISVGTGHRPMTPDLMPSLSAPAAMLAVSALSSVIDDCSWLGQAVLQFLGTSPAPWVIDSEIGDLSEDHLGPQPALHYQRYSLELSSPWLRRELSQTVTPRDLAELVRIDRPEAVPRLLALARLAARRQVRAEHFPSLFDRI
ncbi:MAG TPA: patatin-like phospholipase family protein [Acetobacteraceae bacterium]|nr:patatin-like phospholipase family protein [Acetobacteraceae bacterium]